MTEQSDNNKYADLVDEREDVQFFRKFVRGTISYTVALGLCVLLSLACMLAAGNGLPINGRGFILISFGIPAGIIAALYKTGKNITLMPAAFGLVTALLPQLVITIIWSENYSF